MQEEMRALIEAPLANATKTNLPKGRKAIARERTDPALAKLARERREASLSAKQEQLLDYYATTAVPAERVAEHVGFFNRVQTGTSKTGRPIFTRVPDVGRVEAALKWRRDANKSASQGS